MARNYPRFIFSHPIDDKTKSQDRFIIHTLHPQMIAKVVYLKDGGHQVEPLAQFVEAKPEVIQQTAYRMYDWYTHVRMQEAKISFDFYERTSDIARILASKDFFFHGTVSISMAFKPIMGARLDIKKEDWSVSLNFENNDTYESTIRKLKEAYKSKYQMEPNWPL